MPAMIRPIHPPSPPSGPLHPQGIDFARAVFRQPLKGWSRTSFCITPGTRTPVFKILPRRPLSRNEGRRRLRRTAPVLAAIRFLRQLNKVLPGSAPAASPVLATGFGQQRQRGAEPGSAPLRHPPGEQRQPAQQMFVHEPRHLSQSIALLGDPFPLHPHSGLSLQVGTNPIRARGSSIRDWGNSFLAHPNRLAVLLIEEQPCCLASRLHPRSGRICAARHGARRYNSGRPWW